MKQYIITALFDDVLTLFLCVQYNGGLPPDIILLTQCYYHRGTRLNATKRFCRPPIRSYLNVLTFVILTGGCSEGLDAFSFSLNRNRTDVIWESILPSLYDKTVPQKENSKFRRRICDIYACDQTKLLTYNGIRLP